MITNYYFYSLRRGFGRRSGRSTSYMVGDEEIRYFDSLLQRWFLSRCLQKSIERKQRAINDLGGIEKNGRRYERRKSKR